jgi:hypothetical protein
MFTLLQLHAAGVVCKPCLFLTLCAEQHELLGLALEESCLLTLSARVLCFVAG